MSDEPAQPKGPDLGAGLPFEDLQDGQPRLGHVGGEAVLLVRHGREGFAIGATCSHYGGPLAEGLVVGDRPLSLASRLLQPPHRRGPARSRAEARRRV